MNKWRTLLGVLVLTAFSGRPGSAQVAVIIDTDIGSDCDDAGALALVNALADRGEATLLGVIYSSGANRYGIGVCDAINSYYGRGDVALGQYRGRDVGDPKDHYSKAIATDRSRFPHTVVDSAMGLVEAYKRILVRQPDSSVTLITIGHPNGLLLLVHDAGALALVKRKVKRWVAMAYTGSEPRRDWNFGRNGAERVVDTLLKVWPTPRYFCSLGKEVVTGNRLLPLTPPDNPVREAYRLWNDALHTGRYSWDPLTVLFAVRPGYFRVDTLGSLVQNGKWETHWDSGRDRPDAYRVLSSRLPTDSLTALVEKLISAPPELKAAR